MLDFINAVQPSIPASKTNPVGQTRRIKKVELAIRDDLRSAQKMVTDEVGSWRYELKNAYATNAFYDFQVSVEQIEALVRRLGEVLAAGGSVDAIRRAAAGAYTEGVSRTVDNLSRLSDDFPRTLTARLADMEVTRRATLAGSRAFEQMKGFAAETARDLGRVLFEAVQDGEAPRQAAKTIRERFGVARSRAERIARTEITMAHRRGRWDEARDVEEKFGITTKLLHNSALIPGRTRESHAQRHGKLYTREEVAMWYSMDANAINCLCSQTEVVVGKDGNPLFGQKLIERMGQARGHYIESGIDAKDAK